MRPVDKGDAPFEFKEYQDAGPELQKRLGDYCSYCERQIETHLAVEHIRPKKPGGVVHPERLLDWNNFLLACVNCNSCKSDEEVDVADFLWPDLDNTFRALVYSDKGIVSPASLGSLIEQKALATITLVGLDKYPGNPDLKKRPTNADRRWNKRREVWKIASKSLKRLENHDTVEFREQVIETALGRGMFSIWMAVFQQDADMRLRLIRVFPGTAQNCFDDRAQSISRPGGQC